MKKQNIIKARCPNCARVLTLTDSRWLESVNDQLLPDNLPEENCPECLLEIMKGAVAV